MKIELESSQPILSSFSSSSSESDSAEHQLESIPISDFYIELPFESVSVSNPLYQPASESVSELESERDEMADQRLANQPSLREHLHPERTTPPGPIVFPRETQEARNAFTVKPGVLNSLPNFYGRESDDPYEHVRTFEGLVRNLATTTQYDNACLKLFEATLKDGALRWFRMQKSQSLTTWAHVRDAFYRKYFSEAKTNSLRRQIQGFRQERGESFVKAWERFKDLLLRMPHPGFEKIQLVEFFHLGLNAETIQHIEYSCKGDDFLSKTADEGWDFLDDLADRQRALEPSDFDRSGPSGSNVIPVTIRDQRLRPKLKRWRRS